MCACVRACVRVCGVVADSLGCACSIPSTLQFTGSLPLWITACPGLRCWSVHARLSSVTVGEVSCSERLSWCVLALVRSAGNFTHRVRC
jgi:hypothetical protein